MCQDFIRGIHEKKKWPSSSWEGHQSVMWVWFYSKKDRKERERERSIHSGAAWVRFREAIKDITSQSWRSEDCPVSQERDASVSLPYLLIGWERWGRRGLSARSGVQSTAAPGTCALAPWRCKLVRLLLLAAMWQLRGEWRWLLVNREEKKSQRCIFHKRVGNLNLEAQQVVTKHILFSVQWKTL